MFGVADLLVPEQDLFVELLTGAHAGVADLDVGALFEPGEPDEVPRQVGDPHHLAHVEHEQLAAFALCAGLQHELNGLGDGHEVAPHLRMRDRHRPATFDLRHEGRHHGAARAEHIAEPDDHEVPLGSHGRLAHDDFGELLGRAHDRGRSDRLVGGDEDEMRRAVLDRGVDDVARATDVVRHRFDDVLLHERHMLVRRRVEDGERVEPLEDAVDPGFIADIGDDRGDLQVGEPAPQFDLGLEDLILGVVEDDQELRLERGDLPAELQADAAAGASDHDRASVGEDAHLREVGIDRSAAQEVLDLDRSERAVLDAARDDVGQARHGARAHPHARRQLDDPADLDAAGRGHRDDDLMDAEFAHETRQFVDFPDHPHAVHHLLDLAVVVVDESDHLEVDALAMRGLTGDHLSGSPRADHDRADRVTSAGAPEVQDARAKARCREGGEREHRVDRDRRDRHPLRCSDELEPEPDHGGDDRDAESGDEDPFEFRDAREPPDASVQAGTPRDHQPERESEQREQEQRPFVPAEPGDAFESQHKGDKGDQREQRDVEQQEVAVSHFEPQDQGSGVGRWSRECYPRGRRVCHGESRILQAKRRYRLAHREGRRSRPFRCGLDEPRRTLCGTRPNA